MFSGEISWFLLLIIASSCVGGLMFGYDTGMISGVLVLIRDDLGSDLSTFDKELITSITSLGALFGSIWAGIWADKFGRRPMILVACVVFIVSAIIMALARSLFWLVLGRLIVGLAIGSASTAVPVYIAELSPSKHRGKLVTLNTISTTGGQLLAYLSAAVFQHIRHGWRYIIGISAIPPLIFLISSARYPESPRFLLHSGRLREAQEALSKLYPHASPNDVEQMMNQQSGNEQLDEENKLNLSLLFVPSNLKVILISCGLMATQQLCGFNVFMYYSATVFSIAGFQDPITVSTIVSLTNFCFTIPALFLVDSFGRRKMLLSTVWVVILSLIMTAWWFNSESYLLVFSTVLYVASYAAALGNVPWQSTEFLPLDVRALGSMLMSSTNWICNTLVSMSFLTMLDLFMPKGTFLVYAVITAIAYVGIYVFYPEVSGLSLEEISRLFSNEASVGDPEYTRLTT